MVNKKSSKLKYQNSAYLMIAPAVIVILLFQGVPLIMAIIRAFQDSKTRQFVGFDNFAYVLDMEVFLQSFKNVFIFLFFILTIMVILSFLFAQVLKNMQNRLGSATKIIIYLPMLFSGILIAVMFLFIFNFGGGLITSILLSADKEAIAFNKTMPWPYVLIIGITIWMGFGYHSLVMYAGAINIPKDYYEAARIDGANVFTQLFRITIPCMKNYFILTIINITVGTLMMFEMPFMITGGGPLNKTYTPMLFVYNAFNDYTVGSNIVIAGALMVAVLVAAVNAIVFRVIRSDKSLEA